MDFGGTHVFPKSSSVIGISLEKKANNILNCTHTCTNIHIYKMWRLNVLKCTFKNFIWWLVFKMKGIASEKRSIIWKTIWWRTSVPWVRNISSFSSMFQEWHCACLFRVLCFYTHDCITMLYIWHITLRCDSDFIRCPLCANHLIRPKIIKTNRTLNLPAEAEQLVRGSEPTFARA